MIQESLEDEDVLHVLEPNCVLKYDKLLRVEIIPLSKTAPTGGKKERESD